MRAYILIGVVLTLSTTWVSQPVRAHELRASVEFRRAQTMAGEGLVEAEVPVSKTKVYMYKMPDLTNDDIAFANTVKQEGSGVLAIEIEFTDKGHVKAEKMSKEHKGKIIAILIDGAIVAAPTVKSTFEKKVIITGSFTKDECSELLTASRGEISGHGRTSRGGSVNRSG